VPSRVFGLAARPPVSPRLAGLLSDWLLVQSFQPAEVVPVSVELSRFAVGRFLGFAVFPQQTPPGTLRNKAPDKSSLRVSPPSKALPGES
jgi:hypothetical protein